MDRQKHAHSQSYFEIHFYFDSVKNYDNNRSVDMYYLKSLFLEVGAPNFYRRRGGGKKRDESPPTRWINCGAISIRKPWREFSVSFYFAGNFDVKATKLSFSLNRGKMFPLFST